MNAKDDGQLFQRLLEMNADLAAALQVLLDAQPTALELAQARYALAVANQLMRRGGKHEQSF